MGGRELRDAAKSVARLRDRIESRVDEALRVVMQLMASAASRNVAVNGSIYRSTLVNSIYYRDALYGESGVDGFDGDVYSAHAVIAEAPYAPYVEYGTGRRQGSASPESGRRFKSPSSPPTSEIVEWMLVKGVSPRQYDTVYGAAAAIAESIALHGNRPHPFMRPAYHEHKHALQAAHKYAVRRAIRESF